MCWFGLWSLYFKHFGGNIAAYSNEDGHMSYFTEDSILFSVAGGQSSVWGLYHPNLIQDKEP